MELIKANGLAIRLMAEHELISKGWTFKYDTRKGRLGACNYRHKVIYLSIEWTKVHTEHEVRNTLLHEIAHALTPKQGHNKVWKRKAIEIGCDGMRCYNGNVRPSGKYKAVCKNGHVSYKHRLTDNKYSCGQCSKHYNPEFTIIFKLNNDEQ